MWRRPSRRPGLRRRTAAEPSRGSAVAAAQCVIALVACGDYCCQLIQVRVIGKSTNSAQSRAGSGSSAALRLREQSDGDLIELRIAATRQPSWPARGT
jgi:hypothetical protein